MKYYLNIDNKTKESFKTKKEAMNRLDDMIKQGAEYLQIYTSQRLVYSWYYVPLREF